MMERIAFKMQLRKGFEFEYKKRHDEIWPDLSDLLKKTGISNYSIFLDEATGALFASMEVTNSENLAALPHHPVMKKWWKAMGDIMETNPDNSPISIPLKEVFHLP
ncbi:MAG TPA: L-rhamnose mutarotase [Cyclobacteriaceae bacterium]|nr:L-rhamnose mutarotase [Cyclobacteriaceae bacterium]